ncbi:hypothetical protein [Streptomyces sp. NPDC047928]|uniref:hypothetical protein n=1 Tax=unclassified Streptomyces TaxID=2593676 RepID=UPI00372078B2
MAVLFESGREFEVWSFNASHRQLILRSNPDRIAKTTTRVEVYFGHVEFMSVRSAYNCLTVAEAGAEDASRIKGTLPDGLRGGRIYLLDSNARTFVLSARPAWREAECAFDDPSLFAFDV